MMVTVLLVITYVIASGYILSFTKEEGKDERGKQILTNGYTIAYTIVVLGVLVSYIVGRFSLFSFGYKESMDLALIFIWISGIFNAGYIFYVNKKL
ncbi:hypothetical protein CN931_25200 [Bacillus sp. AFS054943]|uniref:Uncharacterized protein n=2 Tax=Bacillaceae TaxID=186817 RepID=A0A2C1LMK2_BACCE|nr:hypothetical protein CN931_25200 [Bacillus sp. AFS054943]PGT99493.1 hypothetical protein COD19_19440 [Bacillus cereus]